jgi:hypothetical protein
MKFEPRKLIISVVNETKQLFTYKPELKFGMMEKEVLGDEKRLRYILSCLIKNSVVRNSMF